MTSSRPPEVAPLSELAFSQVREDPLLELALVRRLAAARRRPLRVLLVASGGCTALALLARPEVASVDAVDPNPAQRHLVALRALAATRLDAAEQLALLGADPEHEPAAPGAVYARLRIELPAVAREWWDARPEQLAFGLNRVGRFEGLFRDLAAAFARRGLDPVQAPGEALIDQDWLAIFNQVFDREHLVRLFGERAVAYSRRRTFAEHFADVFADALQRFDPRRNHFLHQVFRDRYPPGEAGLPDYMRRAARESLRRRGTGDLRLHDGTLETLLGPLAEEGPYDLIQTSNVTDWMPRDAVGSLFATAAATLAPGGAVLARRLNGDYALADELAPHLRVDVEASHALRRADRSFFYQEVAVAFAGDA